MNAKIAALVVPLLVVLAACSEPVGQAQHADLSEADAVFVAEDIVYAEAPDELAAGEVTLGLDNSGELSHDVAFDGVDGGDPVVSAGGGGAAVSTVTLEPGTYTYYCTVPGHREAGMEGQLVVR